VASSAFINNFLYVSGRIEHLESLAWEDLQVQLAIGLLAGNVFDWGAKEVALLMEESSLVRKSSYALFDLFSYSCHPYM